MLDVVYALIQRDGKIFYVGRTQHQAKRLEQHRARFGRDIAMVVLQNRFSGSEPVALAEKSWIRRLLEAGLDNVRID